MAIGHPALARADAFAQTLGLRLPILLAPMAGACPPSLSVAVADAGGLANCGALLMSPAAIQNRASEVRAATNGPFNINVWIPDPSPPRDPDAEGAGRDCLRSWGPDVPDDAGDISRPGTRHTSWRTRGRPLGRDSCTARVTFDQHDGCRETT
jgi:nitronate monooxygenase